MAGPVADRLYLGDELIYERGQEREPAVPVVPFSSPFVLPTYGGAPSDTTDAESTRSVTPEAGGYAVAFLHLWEDKAVTAPTGFTEHAKMTHPDDALVTLAVYSGPVVAGAPYVWSWSGPARSALRMYVFDGIDLTAP